MTAKTKELPIIFTGTDPAKIRAGTKTQTRRIIKPRKCRHFGCELAACEIAGEIKAGDYRNAMYKPGMRLWVREAWQYFDWSEEGQPWIRYKSDGMVRFFERVGEDSAGAPIEKWEELSSDENRAIDGKSADRKWRSPLFMPRWASPTVIEVVSVRAEWLQDISEAGAIAEGVRRFDDIPIGKYGSRARWSWDNPKSTDECLGTARHAFGNLFEKINGPGSWYENPVVEVVEFKVVTV